MKIFVLLSLLLSYISATAQFVYENNNAEKKAKLKVKTEQGEYLMPDGSVCLMWIKSFNEKGLMTQYKDFWNCGQPYWTYDFEYDANGKCIRSWKSSYKNNFKKNELSHKFDDKHRLVERTESDETGNLIRECYTYDMDGNITNIDFKKKVDGKDKIFWTRKWNGLLDYNIVDLEIINDKDTGNKKWDIRRTYWYYK